MSRKEQIKIGDHFKYRPTGSIFYVIRIDEDWVFMEKEVKQYRGPKKYTYRFSYTSVFRFCDREMQTVKDYNKICLRSR